MCGFCMRAMPALPSELGLNQMATELGLEVLLLRYPFLFPLDVLIKRYKYQGELILANPLADLLPRPPLTVMIPSQGNALQPVLMPVPASPSRIKQRGFDHLHLLSQRYAKKFSLKLAYAQRQQEVASQARLGRRDRKKNLAAVFQVNQVGKAVLLLDDVLTTGATLSALAACCREQGAEWIGAVVLARTPGPNEVVVG